ncbi:MAG: DUF3536 domain-containing protein [Nitrospina sp.]|jgi:alpha-amylase/alpha-mannosidase (GH57 family)|nr:DUF3536 domain-containing protein [Nitrospina sp.]
MSKKFICIHAHFYQPPRENPWTQEIEIQKSAAPYKNWNKRITEECYAPNARARILDESSRIKKIINNYSRISFNFGPTLLSWLESQSQETYQAILDADKESQGLFGGHGSALAQPYNHMIMPLANSRDKLTQILWGIEDFKYRFNREPKGVWLPEAAVDIETLDLLAGEGILFTLLAPSQAKQIKSQKNSNWVSVDENSLDTSRPYKIELPSGRKFSIFFYDKNVSHQLAFENLLSNGDKFLKGLTSKFSTDSGKPELVHAATDGESYGHHHKFGDMTLAYVLDQLSSHEKFSLTNYSQYLEHHPPVWEVEIVDNTSWSCVHGIERWRSNCGCHTGGQEGWSQSWRKPLRESLDELRDRFNDIFEESLKPLIEDPWAARNAYIQLLQPEGDFEKFFNAHGKKTLKENEKTEILKWMEIQRNAMLMYTSCGWFFNDISGIETEQILRYASYALELFSQLEESDLELQFLETLKSAKSNVLKWKNGNYIYSNMVESNRVTEEHIFSCGLLAHLLKRTDEIVSVGTHTVEIISMEEIKSGVSELFYGRGESVSKAMQEKTPMGFFVVNEGDGDFKIYVSSSLNKIAEVSDEIIALFQSQGALKAQEVLKKNFEIPIYPKQEIFHYYFDRLADELGKIFWSENKDLKNKLFENQKKIRLLHNRFDTPLPSSVFSLSREFLAAYWLEILESTEPCADQIRQLIKFADGASIDSEEFRYAYEEKLKHLIERISKSPSEIELVDQLNSILGLLDSVPMKIHLWDAQNEIFEIINSYYPGMNAKKNDGNKEAKEWLDKMNAILKFLDISPQALI